jgi:serine/threonine-protein kinase RsbW
MGEREPSVSLHFIPPMLSLPSDLHLLPVARAFVESVCMAGGVGRELTDAVVLAADEAVNNAIRHAHANDIALTVQLSCGVTVDCIEVHVHDEGEPFDITAVPQLDPGEVRVGGRGLFLMRTMMDEIHCRKRTPRGNIVCLVKRR